MMLSSPIKLPLVFIPGIFTPPEQMPPWGLALSACSPLTYFTDLVRYSFTGMHLFPVVINIAILGVFMLVFTGGSMYLHKRTMQKRI
jgi:ABC-2 type transport system permease protein